jgi:hypothetical protein
MAVIKRKNQALRDQLEQGTNTPEWLRTVVRMAKQSKIGFVKFKEILRRVFEQKNWSLKRFTPWVKEHWHAVA